MKYFGPNMLGSVRVGDKDTYNNNPFSTGFSKVDIPPGRSGDWTVRRINITEESLGLTNLRLIRDGRRDRIIPPGEYTQLVHARDGVVMSDTPAESHEHSRAFWAARGSVLINGLGLGFFLKAILSKVGTGAVTSVTVIEDSQDVIDLVASAYDDPRVTVVCADAFTWQPPKGVKYDYTWHDIWPTICESNKLEMSRLRRKYGRRSLRQGCWSQDYL